MEEYLRLMMLKTKRMKHIALKMNELLPLIKDNFYELGRYESLTEEYENEVEQMRKMLGLCSDELDKIQLHLDRCSGTLPVKSP